MDNIVTLNSSELIAWCRARKKELGLSNLDIAEKTSVPIGTIDRILSGNYSEFKYSSIQPVIAFLVGFTKETPKPEEDDPTQAQYYYNTIEGYKLIVDNKNHELQQVKMVADQLAKEIAFLKNENERKSLLLEKQQELITGMQETITKLVK